MQQTICLS